MFRARVDALVAPGKYGMVACADHTTAREAYRWARSLARLALDPLSRTICGVPRHTALILICCDRGTGWELVCSTSVNAPRKPAHSRLIMGALAQTISERREGAIAGGDYDGRLSADQAT